MDGGGHVVYGIHHTSYRVFLDNKRECDRKEQTAKKSSPKTFCLSLWVFTY